MPGSLEYAVVFLKIKIFAKRLLLIFTVIHSRRFWKINSFAHGLVFILLFAFEGYCQVPNPVHIGSLSNGTGGALLSQPRFVYVSGNYAYVVSLGSDALEIVNVTNRAVPVHAGSLAKGGRA